MLLLPFALPGIKYFALPGGGKLKVYTKTENMNGKHTKFTMAQVQEHTYIHTIILFIFLWICILSSWVLNSFA